MILTGKIFKNNSKNRTVLLNAFYSFFVKGLNIAVNFLTVPLVLTFLNTTQYGIWLTLTAVLGWFSLFDLGFGNGLRNHLTVAVASKNFKEGKIYVSTTYASLTVIFGALIILFLLIHPFINWASVFNAPKYMSNDINEAVLFALCFLFVQFIVRLINTVLLSFQRAAMADFTNALVQIFILIGLYVLKIIHFTSLTAVAIVYSLTPVVVFLTVSLLLYLNSYSNISPSISYVSVQYVNKLLKLGLNFFVIQIAGLVLYASDNFIIAQFFNPSNVTTYNIAFKYFSVTSILFNIALAPFWSMTTQAKVEGDWSWIKASIKKLTFLWIILLFCGVVQLIIARPVYALWTGNKVSVPLLLSSVVFMYFVVSNWCSIYSNFLNGMGKVRIQLYMSIIGMVINIPMAIFFVKTCHFGVIGIPIATVLTMLGANVVGMIQYNKIVNGKADGIWNK